MHRTDDREGGRGTVAGGTHIFLRQKVLGVGIQAEKPMTEAQPLLSLTIISAWNDVS